MSVNLPQSVQNSNNIGSFKPESQDLEEMSLEQIIMLYTQFLDKHMTQTAAQGRNVLGQMQSRSDLARNAQDMANRVEEQIAEAAKEGDKATRELPEQVIEFMEKNNVTVDGKNIKKYLEENGNKLDQGKLKAVKSALDTKQGRETDLQTSLQFKMQQCTQRYQSDMTTDNQIFTALNELRKNIANNIR